MNQVTTWVNTYTQRVGANIKYLRNKNHLSQTALACQMHRLFPDSAELTQTIISQYESGKKPFSLERTLEFCSFFGIDLQDILITDLFKPNESTQNTDHVNTHPVSRCQHHTYYGYFITENPTKSPISYVKIEIFSPQDSHTASAHLTFPDSKGNKQFDGVLRMDESYAYLIFRDPDKDFFWSLTFYYYRQSPNPYYIGGMGLLQALDSHRLPIAQYCIITTNKLSIKQHSNQLENFLSMDSSAKSQRLLRLTKDKDQEVYRWLRNTFKLS